MSTLSLSSSWICPAKLVCCHLIYVQGLYWSPSVSFTTYVCPLSAHDKCCYLHVHTVTRIFSSRQPAIVLAVLRYCDFHSRCSMGCICWSCVVAVDNHLSCACENNTHGDVGACSLQCRKEKLQCQNGGTRSSDEPSPITCRCTDGYYGNVCQHFNACFAETCDNGATCRNTSATTFQCACLDGYFGATCQHFDPCSRYPCDNGAPCRNISDSAYECLCYHGYYGDNCTRFDPCSSVPCLNNAACRNVNDEEYECTCRPGFRGSDCAIYQPCGTKVSASSLHRPGTAYIH